MRNSFSAEKLPIRERTYEKPFMIAVVCHQDLVAAFRKQAEPDIPVFNTPEPAVRALAALWRYQNWRQSH